VFQTAFSLPSSFASLDIDRQLNVLKDRAQRLFGDEGVAQFSDPAKLEALLRRYLTAYIRAQRRVMDRANESAMIDLLGANFKLEGQAARNTYEALLTAGSGLAPDAAFSREGFVRVLSIRAEMEGMWGGVPPAPERYLDLSAYEQAQAQA
jgi:hypothetical protein